MPGASVELVLIRQLASHLAMPILVVDRHLDLVFFNESAESILGRRFDETGGIRRGEWSSVFQTVDALGAAIPSEERPLVIAIDRRKPAHQSFGITGLDGVARNIEGLAFPLATAEAKNPAARMLLRAQRSQPRRASNARAGHSSRPAVHARCGQDLHVAHQRVFFGRAARRIA